MKIQTLTTTPEHLTAKVQLETQEEKALGLSVHDTNEVIEEILDPMWGELSDQGWSSDVRDWLAFVKPGRESGTMKVTVQYNPRSGIGSAARKAA